MTKMAPKQTKRDRRSGLCAQRAHLCAQTSWTVQRDGCSTETRCSVRVVMAAQWVPPTSLRPGRWHGHCYSSVVPTQNPYWRKP